MEMQYRIRKLVVDSKFNEALKYFKDNKHNYSNDEIAGNDYLTSDMLRCLRAIKSWSSGESYLNIYNIQINEHTSDRVINAYLLLLYDWYKAENTSNKPGNIDCSSILDKIISLIPYFAKAKSDFANNFYSTLTWIVLKTESKKSNPDWPLIERFCKEIESGKLSTQCDIIEINVKGKKQSKELASVKEEWYATYSKALFINKNFELCIEISEQALSEISKLHYSNEIWFARRIAQSLSMLGDTQNALKKLEKLIQRKEEWFMLFELAKLYIKLGNEDKASLLLHKAILKPGDISFKVEVLEMLGDYYLKQDNEDLAKDHYCLLIIVRKQEGWSVSPELLIKAGTSTDSTNFTSNHRTVLLHKLKKVWLNVVPYPSSKSQRLQGIVKRMGKPKDAGVDIIIEAENKNNYYAFIKKSDRMYSLLTPGFRISFEVFKLPDKPLDKAIKIRAINATPKEMLEVSHINMNIL